jgi:methyl-accepting chemotaxis protein
VKARLDDVEAELKVRTDIMNLTSIVSEADKKGDILRSTRSSWRSPSTAARADRPAATTPRGTPTCPRRCSSRCGQTIGRGEIFRGVVKNRAKDGTPYYVDAVIAPILGENGKPMKYLGVRYDITEAELERQNARGILAAIDQLCLHRVRPGGHVLTANANFLQALGYQLDEIKGKHHRMFVRHRRGHAPGVRPVLARPGRGKAQQNDVFKRITKAGRRSGSRRCTRRSRTRWAGCQGGEDRHRRDRQVNAARMLRRRWNRRRR